MEGILHHPAVMAFHYVCMISMLGMCFDPISPIFGTVSGYLGHIGSGLATTFNHTSTAMVGTAAAPAVSLPLAPAITAVPAAPVTLPAMPDMTHCHR